MSVELDREYAAIIEAGQASLDRTRPVAAPTMGVHGGL